MKTTKIITIATAITMAIIIACSITVPASAEVGDRGEFYPKMAVVTAIEEIGDTNIFIVTVVDKDGHEWGFFDDEGEWQIGDIANLLMWNLGEREEEDEIVEVYYEGTMDEEALWAWLTGEWQ